MGGRCEEGCEEGGQFLSRKVHDPRLELSHREIWRRGGDGPTSEV